MDGKRKKVLTGAALLLMAAGLTQALPAQKRTLDDASKLFLSEVRYLISRQEKKFFYKLTPAQRPDFIKSFWNKRDPDPYTEENEFKDAYYRRIAEANALFKEGSTPGWLQDRGRVYIMLGPPDDRVTNPGFQDFHYEYWYYVAAPQVIRLVFIDRDLNGDYELATGADQNKMSRNSILGNYALAQGSTYDLAQLQKLMEGRTLNVKKRDTFELSAEMERGLGDNLNIRLMLPYNHIWMTESEGILSTTLSVSLDVFENGSEKITWSHFMEYPVSMPEADADQYLKKQLTIDILSNLPDGNYRMKIEVENKTDGRKINREMRFNLRPSADVAPQEAGLPGNAASSKSKLIEAKTVSLKQNRTFNVGAELQRGSGDGVIFRLMVPYAELRPAESEGDLDATLAVALQIHVESTGKLVWSHSREYPVSLSESETAEVIGHDYVIEVSAALPAGSYRLLMRLENADAGRKLEKQIAFKI